MYLENILPTKRLTNPLKKAIDEAHSFNNQTAEEYTYDPETHNKSVDETSLLELREINSQLMFEKSKVEKSLRSAEEESEELCTKLRNEIENLKANIFESNSKIE